MTHYLLSTDIRSCRALVFAIRVSYCLELLLKFARETEEKEEEYEGKLQKVKRICSPSKEDCCIDDDDNYRGFIRRCLSGLAVLRECAKMQMHSLKDSRSFQIQDFEGYKLIQIEVFSKTIRRLHMYLRYSFTLMTF